MQLFTPVDYDMYKITLLTLAILLSGACDNDNDNDAAETAADAATEQQPDARSVTDANAPVDAAPAADANLSDHGFVEVDGTLLTFETTQTYTNAALGDVTINGQIGSDCPFGANCTTLYVSVPGNATLGYHTCDEALVGVQLSEGSDRFFSFGSASAFCSFDLVSFDTESGGQVAVSNLSAQLQATNEPTNRRLLSAGELRATTN